MAAHQAPPSLGFSRQEHWSGLPFLSPTRESEKWKWSRSVVSDSKWPMNCSLPGFSIHGIFQARVLEWGATAFSKIKYKNYDLICMEFSIVVIYREVTKHDHELKRYNLSLKKFKPDKTSWYLYQSLLYSWNFSVFFKMRVCVLSRFSCVQLFSTL